MSKGEARRSQSAIFNFERKASHKIILRSNKRAREETEDTPPTLLVNQASTSTITEEPITVNVNYLSCRANNNKQNTDKLKLHQLNKESLTRCIENKQIPKGFQLLLEPTIANYDQEFIGNW